MKKLFICLGLATLFASCVTNKTVKDNAYLTNYMHEKISKNCIINLNSDYYCEYADTCTNVQYIVEVSQEGDIKVSIK